MFFRRSVSEGYHLRFLNDFRPRLSVDVCVSGYNTIYPILYCITKTSRMPDIWRNHKEKSLEFLQINREKP